MVSRSSNLRVPVLLGVAAASLVACKADPDLWAEEPEYIGGPGRLCDALREGAAQATFGKLLESEGPMLWKEMGAPVLADVDRGDCLVTCYFPHAGPDLEAEPGNRVRLRGRIRQYRSLLSNGRTTTVELEPCVYRRVDESANRPAVGPDGRGEGE